MLTKRLLAIFAASTALMAAPAIAAPACSSPNALGTSRVVKLTAKDGARYGTNRYGPAPLRPKEVVLTFDDGPVAGTTPKILAALRAECVRANFFMIGKRVDATPEVARRVLADGHVLGSHSWSHVPMAQLAPADQVTDFDKGLASITAITGTPTRLYRFPEFKHTPELLDQARKEGVAVIGADISSEDWRGQAADITLARVLQRLDEKQGGIVLFHDNQPHTIEVLPRFLQALKDRGYKVVQLVPG